MFIQGAALTNVCAVPVTTVGTNALGNFTLLNNGTVNLTNVVYSVSPDTLDPRVAAVVVVCSNLAQNGSLPAGSGIVQCTEAFNFNNITYIEGGDVVFNITAAASGLAAQSQQVTIHVDNTPSLTLALNTTKCAAPTPTNGAGAWGESWGCHV